MTLIWASAVTMAASSIQSTIGFGFAVVSVPFLLAVDPRLAPVPQLLLSIPLAVAIVWRERGGVDMRGTKWLVIGLVGGSFLGLWFLKELDEHGAELAVGIAVLVMTLMIHSGWKPSRTRTTLLGGGIASGVMSLLASMGGPPIALIYHPQPGDVTRPTINLVFLVGLLGALALRLSSAEISTDDVRLTFQLLPSLVVGFWIGGRVLSRIGLSAVRQLTLVVAAIGAVSLIVSAGLKAMNVL